MDVAYEMEQVRRKVQVQIDRQALEAEARVFGMTPIGYAMQIENIRRERQKTEREQMLERIRVGHEALGRQLRLMADSWKTALDGIAKGFNGG